MSEIQDILQVVGTAGGGVALLVWVLTRPHVLEGIKHILDWWPKRQAQLEDLSIKKIELLIRQEAGLAAARDALIRDLQTSLTRNEARIIDLQVEVQALTELERGCREEMIMMKESTSKLMLQNQMMAEQNSALKAMTDQSAGLLRALETTHPEWFGGLA